MLKAVEVVIYIYIYIWYIKCWVQVTPAVTLSNVTLINIF